MSCVVQTIAVNESTFRKQVLQCMCCNACCTRHVNCELLPNVVCGVRGCFLPYDISTACLGRYSGDRYRGGPPADADIPKRCARDRFSGLRQQPRFHRLLRLLACIHLPCSNAVDYMQGFAKNDMAQMFLFTCGAACYNLETACVTYPFPSLASASERPQLKACFLAACHLLECTFFRSFFGGVFS